MKKRSVHDRLSSKSQPAVFHEQLQDRTKTTRTRMSTLSRALLPWHSLSTQPAIDMIMICGTLLLLYCRMSRTPHERRQTGNRGPVHGTRSLSVVHTYLSSPLDYGSRIRSLGTACSRLCSLRVPCAIPLKAITATATAVAAVAAAVHAATPLIFSVVCFPSRPRMTQSAKLPQSKEYRPLRVIRGFYSKYVRRALEPRSTDERGACTWHIFPQPGRLS